MATPEEQITPADAAIVTTGTGRKGPEEHDLPESLKYDMDPVSYTHLTLPTIYSV